MPFVFYVKQIIQNKTPVTFLLLTWKLNTLFYSVIINNINFIQRNNRLKMYNFKTPIFL